MTPNHQILRTELSKLQLQTVAWCSFEGRHTAAMPTASAHALHAALVAQQVNAAWFLDLDDASVAWLFVTESSK